MSRSLVTRTLLVTTVLVHAAYRGSPLHARAAALVDLGLRKARVFCISPQNLVEFCAVVTRRRFVDPPLPAAEARRMARILYASRRLSKVYPKRGTIERALRDGADLGITGPAWYDLYLAATMRDSGVRELVTENRSDFARIPFVTARSLEEPD